MDRKKNRKSIFYQLLQFILKLENQYQYYTDIGKQYPYYTDIVFQYQY